MAIKQTRLDRKAKEEIVATVIITVVGLAVAYLCGWWSV
jgi:biotin transporter BioY